MPAILKKFVSKEATSEAAILKLYLAARPCLCNVIPSDLKLAGRRKSATDLHQNVFFQAIIHFTIFNAVISESGACLAQNNREFTKPRRQRQWERHWTKELMTRTMAVLVRYNSWYISLPSFARQQRERTKFCVVWKTWTTTANILNLYFQFIAVFRI